MRTQLLVLTVAALSLLGCATTMDPLPGAMSDAEIAAIVTTAHEGEISHGNGATPKASSTEVREFAQMLVSDHTNALNNARETFNRAGVTPMENDASNALRNNAERTWSALTTYSGRDFDRQFVKAQVDQHQWLLNTLDQSLIPAARNAEVRALLQTQRGSVARHLDHGRRLWNSM